jgi:universal stress protein E
LTDDDLNLVRLCPTPLWLVRGRAWPEQAAILGAIDPLHQDDKDVLVDDLILTTTAHIAKALHGTAHALHAIPEALSVATALGEALLPEQVDTLEKQIERHHASEVYRLTEAHGFDKSRVHLHTQRDVVEALAQIAKPMQVGLIVLGALSRNPLKHMLLGGTADRVLRKLHVDVLVIKPPEHEE